MSLTIEKELFAELVQRFRERICTGPGEKINPALYLREGGRRVLHKWGGFGAGAAAFLALTKRPDNPWAGRDELLQFAFDAGERLLIDHAELGRPQVKPNHFTIYPLTPLYDLAAEHAGAARRGRWRDLMLRNLHLVDRLIERTGPTLGLPGPYAGTGPDHIFGWLAIAYGQAKALHDDKRMRRYEKAFLKHLTLQAPGGYFPEHLGPVVEYHMVSLEGVAEFYYHRANPEVRRALTRGITYFVRMIYPDLRPIETMDERNRLGHAIPLRGALVWTAEGRGLLRKVLEKRRAHPVAPPTTHKPKVLDSRLSDGVYWWGLGSHFRTLEQAGAAARLKQVREAPLPIDRPRFSYRLESKGLVRKEGPWFYALSAYAHPTLPGNPYHFERSQAFSLYHEKAGLIIGGGHDKRAPHNSTVHVVEEGEVHYHPALDIDLKVAQPARLNRGGRVDSLGFDFGCAEVQFEVAVRSARSLTLALAARSNMVNHEIALVLQLALTAPATLSTGNAAGRLKRLQLKPMREGQPLAAIPLGSVLERPGCWRMRLPAGCTLQWPHRPWHPYGPPEYRDPLAKAVALVRVPTNMHNTKAKVTIEILA